MNFKSLDFFLVFPVVVVVLFTLPRRLRWVWLLAASLFFYSRWKAVYILLLVAHTMTDWVLGWAIYQAKTKARKRLFLGMSLVAGLGLLGYFKYTNFLLGAAYGVSSALGHAAQAPHFDIVLPIGISFYTFQTLSYTIDIYRGQVVPERHPGYFMLYVTYFPHMVAGPIMRAPTLLGELHKKTSWDSERAASGLRRMAWGFFKKLVIADRLSDVVHFLYHDPDHTSGGALLVATYFFAFAIYADFSGYSDIAIGAARIMGHDLIENFDRPYFATSISTFWRRWHISLQTWFRDYLFLPLMGGKSGLLRQLVCLLLVFLASGLWHGANWTFVVWGLIHGVALVVETLANRAGERLKARWVMGTVPAWLRGVVGALVTFHVVLFSYVFFISRDLPAAWMTLKKIAGLKASELWSPHFVPGIFVILILLGVEAAQGIRGGRIEDLLERHGRLARWCAYATLAVLMLILGMFGTTPFIYFQF